MRLGKAGLLLVWLTGSGGHLLSENDQDGGRGGERDEWRKRVGDGLGVNREALPLCDRDRGLAGDFSLRLPTYAAAPGGLKQKRRLAKSTVGAAFL